MPIGKDRYVREKQAVRKLEAGGKQAVTVYEVKETFNVGGEKFALLRLSPKTGRTHQLRVHMAAIGCPIVGDTTYGGRVFESGDFRFDRQALHAFEITFVHPGTLKTMTLSAPLPPDITELLGRIRDSR
jgi:23S rRNA pseudouridine1911/1915/1917 synthase